MDNPTSLSNNWHFVGTAWTLMKSEEDCKGVTESGPLCVFIVWGVIFLIQIVSLISTRMQKSGKHQRRVESSKTFLMKYSVWESKKLLNLDKLFRFKNESFFYYIPSTPLSNLAPRCWVKSLSTLIHKAT